MQPEIESLLRDIGALGDQVRAAAAPTAPTTSSFDIDSLQADIERAIAEAQASPKMAAPIAVPIAAKQPAPPPRIDPLLQEIDAALADDADSLVARAGGDVRAALASVFDEGALAGLDEEINRALIEAFGTSKLDNPTFRAETIPRITNPVAKFDGIAKKFPHVCTEQAISANHRIRLKRIDRLTSKRELQCVNGGGTNAPRSARGRIVHKATIMRSKRESVWINII